ncbi:MAG: hypothetical protein KAH23_07255, partial [Kiritimatiellae bacterium]|nr:hypothetical protein [Kiritimatiellia bacterium]
MIYQQVIYLANVLSIACSDGKITPDEDKILKSIASRIGADVNTVEQAKKLLIKGNYVLQPLKVTTDRVRNIEDMVMVAMADGKLGESEAAPIEQFTDMLGITQKEMDSIVARAQAKLQEDTEAIRYTKRRVARKAKTVSPPPPLPEVVPPPLPPLPVSTKVEQHVVEKKQKLHSLSKPSGHHQRKKQKKPEDRRPVSKDQYKPPADGLVITFSGSSSDVMTVALDALRSAPESGEHRTSSGKLYYGIWPDANLVKATGVALAIAGLLSRKVYVNGEEVSWDDLFAFTRCAVKRIASDNPVEYCFGCYDESLNIWGCRQAGMDWSETAEWFALGSFKDADGFIFDKNAISAMPETTPCSCCTNTDIDHQGVFLIKPSQVDGYARTYNPVHLRWDRKISVHPDFKVMNFGESKGETFEGVLIYPTQNMIEWIGDNSVNLSDGARA